MGLPFIFANRKNGKIKEIAPKDNLSVEETGLSLFHELVSRHSKLGSSHAAAHKSNGILKYKVGPAEHVGGAVKVLLESKIHKNGLIFEIAPVDIVKKSKAGLSEVREIRHRSGKIDGTHSASHNVGSK